MRTLNCPRCQEPMRTQTVAAPATPVVIDVCDTGCGGLWLDDADMHTGLDVTDDLQAVSVTPCRTPDCGQPASCPICGEPMQRYRWNYTSPVTLDQCAAGHGTWVDAGEVQAMEEFEEHEILPDDQKARLRLRIGIDRLEIEERRWQEINATGNPLLRLLEIAWGRFL
jgi:Zn-finger nucleic acid-binding protein